MFSPFPGILIDAGITAETAEDDVKYIRFLNATLVLFVMAQLPILWLLFSLGLGVQIFVNLTALALAGLGFALNVKGRHQLAKIVVLTVLNANTAYFAVVIGSMAPTHFWLIPMAVLGLLVFKPSERFYTAIFVGCSMIGFWFLEIIYLDLEPVVHLYQDAIQAQKGAQGSTIFSILLTLALVGMMHQRFAGSEASLFEEKAKSERLLRAILPIQIANELRETGTTKAVRHEDVSILFADIVGFTNLAASMPAEDVVQLLATVFERFDALIEECGVEKIKTIGDAYMVAGGVPQNRPDHADRLARCASGMLNIVENFSVESGHHLQLRIGLHRGPAVAGVIGTTKFAYDLWGDSVNLAARLESCGEPGRIHVSDAFRKGSENTLHFEERGEVSIKGVGLVSTHWLVA